MVANFTWVNIATFNLPGFGAGASIVYGTPGLTENGGVPNITGVYGYSKVASDAIYVYLGDASGVSGAFYLISNGATKTRTMRGSDGSYYSAQLGFDASRISSVYNNSTKVYASGLKMRFIIKY